MICASCGSEDFFELPDGHKYCSICQTLGEVSFFAIALLSRLM